MKYASDRLASVGASASERASAKARALINQGVDIISLASGEPDFDTPRHIVDAAIAALNEGQTHYTGVGGTPELKDAIITKFSRDNGLTFTRNEVMATPGAKSAVYMALLATLDAGDEVIVPAPHWVSYTDMTTLAGGASVVVPCGWETQYKLTPGLLRSAITPRTRWLVMNSPNNPSGAVYSETELEQLAAVLREHPQILVMMDEIYEHIIFDGRTFHSLAKVAPDLAPRILTLNGVSKGYAMTGWRIGFVGGPAALIDAMKLVQSQSIGSLCSFSLAGAIVALTGPQDFLPERAEVFRRRRDLMVERINAIPGLDCQSPEGAFYLFVDCKALLGKKTPGGARIETDKDVADFLLEDARVAVVNGAAYGLSPYIRLSIATSDDKLSAAADRIAAAVPRLS